MKKHLHILWTNADPITSELMVFMYATNAMKMKWWDKVTVIIWGATSKLVAESGDIQDLIEIAKEAGVEFSACISCANKLNTFEAITNLDIELKGWGAPLTEILQNDEKLITV